MELAVKTNSLRFFNDPEGFKSTDRCACVVRPFCIKRKIPYSDTFVSISVTTSRKPGPLKRFGRRHVYNANDAYGEYPIQLADKVIKDIEVVTVGDFHTVMSHAIQLYFASPDYRALRKYLKQHVIDLRGKKVSEKKRALKHASQLAPRTAYAEARIFRPLKTGDKGPTSSS